MRMPIRWLLFTTLCYAYPLHAELVKCRVNGKTLYTDDPKECKNAQQKPVNRNVVFSNDAPGRRAPAGKDNPAAGAAPSAFNLPGILGNLPLPAGVSKEDFENGWKTIMEAKKRGSWAAPQMPDEAK